ncbi:MAG: hypothetical protein QTN59_20065 [Candidatus Electrothrix communis]|nr:MAG: hypothetical protein QTN59_18460 [Candidatus Electrothrix communis]WLE96957.1 MAG: hypothetical protein QTN59_20065 [Candidatus Electrothrix communis]
MSLVERYNQQISGVYSCFDRVVINGTLPGFCYAEGMTSYLYANNIRIFDYTKFTEPLRNEIRSNAEYIANKNKLSIDFIRKNNFRKEQRVRDIITERGRHPGVVHIFSAMEPCASYRPWHDKKHIKLF